MTDAKTNLSLKETCKLTGMTPYKIHVARKAGELSAARIEHKHGKGYEFNKAEVIEWLQLKGIEQEKQENLEKEFETVKQQYNHNGDDTVKQTELEYRIKELEKELSHKDEIHKLERENLTNLIKNLESKISMQEHLIDELRKDKEFVRGLLPEKTETAKEQERKKIFGIF